MYRLFTLCLLGLALSIAVAPAASAQGFGVYEQSPCMAGRGGAGVAAPCMDGSGMFYNPAALSFDSTVLTLGSVVIGPTGTFTDTSGGALNGTVSTLNKKWYPVPNIYASMPIGKRIAFGVGVMAPYGLTTDWPVSSQGRYLGYKSLVQGVYVQPTVSVKLSDNLFFGVGIDVTHLTVELRQRVDLSAQLAQPNITFRMLGVPANTDFADIALKGTAWHAGYHIGLMAKASDRLSLGVRYLSGQNVAIDNGTITTQQIMTGLKLAALGGAAVDNLVAGQFASGAKLSNQAVATAIPLPAQIVAGVGLKASKAVTLFFDYQWTKWSDFKELPMNGQYLKQTIVEDYGDVSGFRVGTEIAVGARSTLRGGINIHDAAAPDQTVTPNLPEGKRREYNVGFGSQLSKRLRFDLSYMYLYQPERAGRTLATTTNNGIYDFGANLFGASLTVKF